MKLRPTVLLLACFITGVVAADPMPLNDFRGLIGATPAEAVDRLGAPDELAVHRGSSAGQDDVIWYYHPGFYLFFFESRVWQVRADDRFDADQAGLTWGESLDDLVGRIGPPLARDEKEVYFDLVDTDPPLRLRVFGPDGVSDAYLYRSDY